MVDRLAENGAVQYGKDRWSFENNDSRLAGAGQIANEIRRLVEEGEYTDYVSGLSVKGRLINRMIDVVYWPRKLFQNGELGTWFDPSDMSTLFQDAAGTTPVTAIEQPVGLMLDKSEGLVLGPELVTNGTFDTDSDWGAGPGITISDGTLNFNTTSNDFVAQNISITAGKIYKIELDITSYTRGVFNLLLGITNVVVVPNPSVLGRKTLYVTAGTSTANIRFQGNFGSGCELSIDNVTVKEISGNHAYQTTSTARPVLRSRYNLLTYTEQFDNAAWVKGAVSITQNTIAAPDGTTTADTLEADGTLAYHNIQQLLTLLATVYTFSIYAKKGTNDFIQLRFSNALAGGSYANFDLSDGSIGDYTVESATISDVGNGWYKCTITDTTAAAYGSLLVGLVNSKTAISGANVTLSTNVYIWGADLRISNDGVNIPSYQRIAGSSDYDTVGFKPYLSFDGTDDFMVTNSIDFSTVTSDGEARRNLLTYPSAFDNSAWTKTRVSATANATTVPNGTTTADAIIENTDTNTHEMNQFNPTAGVTYTLSFYLKAITSGRYLTIAGFGSVGASEAPTFNPDNGTVELGATSTIIKSATITSAENGWYYCTTTFTAANTAAVTFALSNSATTNAVASYTGDGTSGIYLWGAQLEVGSSATDFQDIGTDKMTVWAGVRKLSDALASTFVELSASRATNNGAFTMSAPPLNLGNNYNFASKGTSDANAIASIGSFVSPITNVLTGIGDISDDSVILKVNEIQAASSTSDQGAGNYGNYPLYIGRRGGTTLPFTGRLYGLIVRGAQSTDAEITNTETWMNNKTGAY